MQGHLFLHQQNGNQQIKSKRDFFCGVDGGGSKTHAVIIDDKDNTFEGLSKASNPNKVGLKESGKNLIGAIQNAIITNNLQIKLTDLKRVCFGVAGTGIEETKLQLFTLLKKDIPLAEIELKTDAEIALEAVSQNSKVGIVQIAGTGAITFGQSKNTFARSDGFGSKFGDKGSGFYIGQKGIEAVLRHLDGRKEYTSLVTRLFNYFSVNGLNDLRRHISEDTFNPSFFAETVAEEAKKGDDESTRIIRKASFHIAESIISVIDKLNLRKDKFSIGFCGSIFKTGEIITLPIISRVTEHAQKAVFLPELVNPALSSAFSVKAL